MPPRNRHSKTPRFAITFPAVQRRTYWIGTGVLTLVLVALSWLAGFYYTTTPEGDADRRITTGDPITELLYTPLGNAVVLLVIQFVAANVLFWIGAWAAERMRG